MADSAVYDVGFMRKILLIAICFGLVSVGYSQITNIVYTYQGIELIFPTAEGQFNEYAEMGCKPIKDRERRLYTVKLFEQVLQKYPPGLVRKYLDRIYFIRELWDDWGWLLGLCDDTERTIYLVNKDFSDNYFEQTVHHELLHLFAENNPELKPPKKVWKAFNATGFHYKDVDDPNAIMKKSLIRQGILCLNARVDTDEDMAVFAEHLFCAKHGFWRIVEESPQIRGKFKLMIEFYQKIDPMFTEEYFRRISGWGAQDIQKHSNRSRMVQP